MADITFDQLLDEQKKTTSSLNRLGKTLRQQLLGDKSQEKDQSRVDAGNKAWQTRQINIAEAGKKVGEISAVVDERQTSFLGNMLAKLNFLGEGTESASLFNRSSYNITQQVDERQTSFLESMLDKLNFLGKGTKSASQEKEDKKDDQSFMSKTFGKLGGIFTGGFKSMIGVLGKFKTTAMTGLSALLTAAGLFALIKFLESETWKNIRDWMKKEGPQILEDLWTNLKAFLVTLGEYAVDIFDAFSDFFGTIMFFFPILDIKILYRLSHHRYYFF